jgi:hypothetical protein
MEKTIQEKALLLCIRLGKRINLPGMRKFDYIELAEGKAILGLVIEELPFDPLKNISKRKAHIHLEYSSEVILASWEMQYGIAIQQTGGYPAISDFVLDTVKSWTAQNQVTSELLQEIDDLYTAAAKTDAEAEEEYKRQQDAIMQKKLRGEYREAPLTYLIKKYGGKE